MFQLEMCIPTYWWGGNFETLTLTSFIFLQVICIPTYWWGGNFETTPPQRSECYRYFCIPTYWWGGNFETIITKSATMLFASYPYLLVGR